MKKIYSIFYTLLVLVAVTVFHSCSEDEYQAAEQLSNAQVFFPTSNSATINISKSVTSFDILVKRMNTDGALSVAIVSDGGDGLYNIPTTVEFADGDNEATLTITYDPNAIDYDLFTDIAIKISDESLITPYGMSEYDFSVGIPAPWKSLGKCTFVEDFITSFYGVSNIPYAVEIQENELLPGYFRLVNPFGAAYGYNEEGDWDASRDWYLEIHAENPDAVYIDVQQTGMDWGSGMISVGSMAGYYIAKGQTLEQVQAQGLTGTYVDGVITFPVGTLLISEAGYDGGALYPANNNGAFSVVMPGVVIADYTLEIEYNGKYTNADNEDAGVIVGFTKIGADLDTVRVAIVAGSDVDMAAEGIINGSIDYLEIDNSETESLMLPFTESIASGDYMIVAVGYSNGEATTVTKVDFKY